jgi:hypothetical protein
MYRIVAKSRAAIDANTVQSSHDASHGIASPANQAAMAAPGRLEQLERWEYNKTMTGNRFRPEAD